MKADYKSVARSTDGYSGRDLQRLCEEVRGTERTLTPALHAAMTAARLAARFPAPPAPVPLPPVPAPRSVEQLLGAFIMKRP